MKPNEAKYWIGTISKEHTDIAVVGKWVQVCNGKQAPLKRMKTGDFITIYSPKITMTGAEKYQHFTAIGKVNNDTFYQAEMFKDFHPFRRDIEFLEVTPTPIQPLINDLEFIVNKKSWGYPFRFGFFEINKHDFDLIASKMIKKEL